jgi:hypothetical protein
MADRAVAQALVLEAPRPLRPLIEQRSGQAHGAARPNARRSTNRSLQTSLYGFRGLPHLSYDGMMWPKIMTA